VNITDEVQVKLDRVRGLMKEKHLDVVLLSKNENFFWITGGKSAFVDKSGPAASKIMITAEQNYVVCNSSERYRVMDEELTDGTFELIPYLWHESEAKVLEQYFSQVADCDVVFARIITLLLEKVEK